VTNSILTALTLYAVGLAVLYWVIRKAVAHGIRDADHARNREQ
jgi:hypothetical protein